MLLVFFNKPFIVFTQQLAFWSIDL